MKIVVAIDSFKGSLSSSAGSQAIMSGIREVYPYAELIALPLADGGEGTVAAVLEATGGTSIPKIVTGPLAEPVEAIYGISGDERTVVIEAANVCGLPLVPADMRNPMLATSRGIGELIADAIEQGYRSFVVGLGGSATNDAGIGMLQALGFSFLDEMGQEVEGNGRGLSKIRSVGTEKVHPLLKDCTFRVACDVNNPLHGLNGAAFIYGPQKGASPEMVEELDNGLQNIATVVKAELAIDIHNIAGAGAAGGLGAAFAGFLGARLQSGIELILDLIKMDVHLHNADFVITGEGKLDGQTAMGKAPAGVAGRARRRGIPAIALAGGVSSEAAVLNDHGVTAYFPVVAGPVSLEEAMDPDTAYENLHRTASQLFRLIRAAREVNKS